MRGTGLHRGFDGLAAAWMQADGCLLQVVGIPVSRADLIERSVDLRGAELGLICAHHQRAGKTLGAKTLSLGGL